VITRAEALTAVEWIAAEAAGAEHPGPQHYEKLARNLALVRAALKPELPADLAEIQYMAEALIADEFSTGYAEAVARGYLALVAELAEARAELTRLHSWEGLMELLDEHWPTDLIPTLPDDDTRDPGPRIVSLLRWVAELRARPTLNRRDARALLAPSSTNLRQRASAERKIHAIAEGAGS
jgi:hypothetical protein